MKVCGEPWRKEEGAGVIMSLTDVISGSSAFSGNTPRAHRPPD